MPYLVCEDNTATIALRKMDVSAILQITNIHKVSQIITNRVTYKVTSRDLVKDADSGRSLGLGLGLNHVIICGETRTAKTVSLA